MKIKSVFVITHEGIPVTVTTQVQLAHRKLSNILAGLGVNWSMPYSTFHYQLARRRDIEGQKIVYYGWTVTHLFLTKGKHRDAGKQKEVAL